MSHFENSISFPIDYCTDEFFINWNGKHIQEKILRNKVKKELFEQRKRKYVFIIASSNDISNYLDKLPKLTDSEALDRYVQQHIGNRSIIENLLSVRNAIMLYKALKSEKIREVYLCVNGFDTFKQKYPFFCKFRTSFLYPKK